MTMVPSANDETQLCTQQLHHCIDAAGYGGEIESIRHRFRGSCRRQSTSSSPSPSPAAAASCNNNSQSVGGFGDHSLPDEMADRDEFRPVSDPNQPSSSSVEPRVDDSWLCLRLGGDDQRHPHQPTPPERLGLVELDLLPGSSTGIQHQVRNTGPPTFFQTPDFRSPLVPAAWPQVSGPEVAWTMMRPSNIMAIQHHNANPSLGFMTMGPNFFARPYASPMGLIGISGACGGASTSGGMRIIRPPRRPQVGVWFLLQASQNQVIEPFLPQIPKRYLRIKDGRMTVRLLQKYLAHKLRLESESEVEIRCRGQELEPVLRLQHVRDHIWCNLLTDSSSTTTFSSESHIMILHYARPTTTTNTLFSS